MAMQQPPANSTESTSDAPAVSAVSTKPLDIDLIARVFQGYYFRKVTMGYLFLLTRIISLSAKILSPKHKKERSLFWIATKIPATLALIVNVGLIFFMSGLLIAFSSVMFLYQFAGNGLQSLLNIMGSKKTLNSPLPRALKDFSTINDRMLKRILAQIGSAVSKLLSILYTKGTTISPATIKASLTSVIKMIKQTPSLIFSTQASSDLSATAAPGIKLNVTALIGLLELSKTLVSPELFNLLCPPKDLSSPEAASPYLGIYPLMQEYFLNQTLAPKTQASTLLSILAKLKESSIFYDLIQAGNQTESEETVRFCLTLINSGTPPLFKENTETLLANQLRAIIRTTAAAHTKEAWMTQQRALFEPIIAAVTLMTADDNYDTTAAYIQKMSAPAPSPSEPSPSDEDEAPAPASPLMPSGAEIALFTDIVDALAPCPLLSLATSGPVKELTQSLSTHLTNPSALTPVATLLEQFPAQITKNQGPILHAVTRVIRAFNDVEILDVTTEISYTLQDLINPSEPPKPPLTSIQKIDMMQALLTALEIEPSETLFTALHHLQAALQPPSCDPALPFSALISPFIPQDLQIYSPFICTLCDHMIPSLHSDAGTAQATWVAQKTTVFATLRAGIVTLKADAALLETLDEQSDSNAAWAQTFLPALVQVTQPAETLLAILTHIKESSMFYDLIQAGTPAAIDSALSLCINRITDGTPPFFNSESKAELLTEFTAMIQILKASATQEEWMTQQRTIFAPIIAAVTLMTADDNYDTTAAYIQKMSAPAPSPSESSPSVEDEAPPGPLLMPSRIEIALFTDIVDALAPCPLLSLATSGPVKELTQSLSTHLTNPSALTPVATLLEQFPAQITENQIPILHAVTKVIRAFNDVKIFDDATGTWHTLLDVLKPPEPPKPPLTSIQKIDMMQALLTALEREPSDALFTALHRLQAALQPPALQPPSRDPALPFSSLIAPFIPQDLQIYSSFICTLCDHIMPTPCDSDAPPEETWQQHKSTLFTTLQKGIDLCKADPRLLDTLDLSSSSEATWSQKLLNAIFLKAPTTALSAASSLSASPGTSSMAAPDVETPLLTLPSVPFHQEQYFILTLEFFKAFLDKSKESDFFASTLTAVDRPLFQVMLDQMYPTTIDSPINPKSPTRAARTCLEHLYSSLQYSADFVANQTLCFQALSDMTQLTLNYEGDLQALWSPPVFPMNEEQTTYIKALFRCMDTVPLSLLYEIMLPMITPILHLTEHATLINLHKITNGDPTNIEKILSSFNKIRTLTLQYQGDLTALLRTPQFPLRTDQTQYLQDLAACLTELPWATLLMHAETQVVLNDLLELSGCAEELKRTILALQAHLAQHPKDLAALTQTETLSKVLTMLFHPNMQTLLRKTQDSTEVLPLNKTQQHAQCLLKILCDNDEHAFTELKTASYRIQRLHLSPSLLRARPTQPLTLSASLTPVDIENIIATLNAPDDYATWLSTFRSTYPDKAQDYLDAIITHYRSFVPTEIPGYSVTNAIIQTLHPNHIPSIGVLIQCVDSLIPTSSTLNHYSDTALVTPESMDGDNTPEESRVNGHKGLSAILASMVTGKQALPLIRGEEEAGAVPLVLHQFLRTMKEDSKIEFDFDSLDRHHPITSDDMTLELDDENEKKRVCMAKIIKNIQSLSDIDLIYKAKALDALYQSLSSLNPSKALPANLHTVSDADLRASLQDSSLTHLEYIQTTLANYIPKANLSRFLGAAIAPLLCPSESGSVNDRPPELMDFFQQIQNFYYSNPEDAETFLKQQFPQWDREKENFHLGLSHYFIALKYMHAKESELFSQFLQEQQEVLAQAQAQAQMLAFFCDATLLPEDKDLLDADLLSADPILLPVQAQRSTDTTHPPFKGIQAAIDHVLTKEIMNYNGLAGLLAQLDPHIISLLQAEYSHKPESIGLVALILEQFYHYDNPGQDSVFITNLLDYSLRNLDATHFHNLVHAVGTGEVNNIIYYLFVTQASLDHGPQHLNTESFNQDLFDKLLMNDPDRTAMFLAKTILFVLPSAKRLAPQELYDLENEIATDLSLLTKNPETFKSLAKGLFILMHPATERTPGHSKTEAIRMLVKGIKPLVERVPPATLLYHIIQSPDIKNSIIQACPQRLQTPILALFAQLGNKESDDRLMLQNILQFALDNSDNLVHNWPKCIVNAIAFLSSWGFSTALAATQEAAYTMAQETKEMGNDAYEAIQTATYTASFMATTLLSSTISACRGFFQASMPAIVQGTTQDLEMIPPLQAFAMIPSSESVPTQLKPQSTHKKSLIASEPSLPSPPLSNHRKKRERL